MNKMANIIVKQKNIIFTLILLITIGCALLIPKVKINYDMSKYLPEQTDVYRGLQRMDEHFELLDNAQIMVKEVEVMDCESIQNALSKINGVKSIDFDVNSPNYYQNKNALFVLTIGNNVDSQTISNHIYDTLKDHDIAVSGSMFNSLSMTNSLKNEMPIFLGIAIVFIIIILLIISHSWIEPLLFLSISAISIVINYGTNLIFGEISFVTFAIAALLQLALSMDYSIMLLDQFHHESKNNSKNEAMIKAWKKSFHAITSSSLTTIFGLLAMLFMSFTIGKDLGLVLGKGILINVVVVFLALPSLILISNRILSKTKKKAVQIPTNFLSKLNWKKKYGIVCIFVLFTIGAFFIQNKLNFTYSIENTNQDTKEILKEFGTTNQFVILYQDDTNNQVNKVINFIESYHIEGEKISKNIMDYQNTIARPVSVNDVQMITSLSTETIQSIFALYHQIYPSNEEQIPINQLLDFITNTITKDERFASLLSEEFIQMLDKIQTTLQENKKLLVYDNYYRMIIHVNQEIESENALTFYQDINNFSKLHLKEAYVLGETALADSIENSFASETLWITIITIISIILVIAITYQSIGLPILLVTLIQSAIWISLCYPVIAKQPLFFLAYIIVQCIQMGATIDYAILLSSNYMNNRQKQTQFIAMQNALNASIMTIFTSASILITATLTIALISSQNMISTICATIGRGTIVSTIIVLIVLPACLLIGDRLLEKTTRKKKFYEEK